MSNKSNLKLEANSNKSKKEKLDNGSKDSALQGQMDTWIHQLDVVEASRPLSRDIRLKFEACLNVMNYWMTQLPVIIPQKLWPYLITFIGIINNL